MARNELDDLSGLDLEGVDLDEVDLELTEPGVSGWRYVEFFLMVAVGAVVLWFPNSEYYLRFGPDHPIFFALCAAGIIDGLLLGRWLIRWANEAQARWAREAERLGQLKKEPPKPPSALQRWSTLIIGIGGAVAVTVGVPASSYYGGGDSQLTWFLGAGGALAVGATLGRWLLLQANRPVKEQAPVKPIVLPPWFKWVTLSILACMGLFALVGMQLIGPGGGQTVEFAAGGVAFIVGIFGAIWVARRFDELEKKGIKPKPRRRD